MILEVIGGFVLGTAITVTVFLAGKGWKEFRELSDLQELKAELNEKIKILDKRIETRKGPNYHDEENKIEQFHSEAFAYEMVLGIIDKIEKNRG